MTTLHRLIAGMVNDKVTALRANRGDDMDRLKYTPWAKLPSATRRLIQRAEHAKAKAESLEKQIEKAGYCLPSDRGSVRGSVLKSGWWSIERAAKDRLRQRLEAITKFKARAMTETLGMDPAKGVSKAKLEALARELEQL